MLFWIRLERLMAQLEREKAHHKKTKEYILLSLPNMLLKVEQQIAPY